MIFCGYEYLPAEHVLKAEREARQLRRLALLLSLAVVALVVSLWVVSHRYRPVIVIPRGAPMSVRVRPWTVYPNPLPPRGLWRV
jgi:hypothetical protein